MPESYAPGTIKARAELVANIRILAAFIEQSGVPVPRAARAQWSILESDIPDYAGRLAEVARVAELLGVPTTDDGQTATYAIGDWPGRAEYVIHAQPAPEAGQ